MTEEIRVLIADDQRVVREGLATLLGLLPGVTVVGAVGDGEQAVSNALELAPDVVLMDLRMPRCDGVEATRRLLASNPEAKVLVLTTYADDRSVVQDDNLVGTGNTGHSLGDDNHGRPLGVRPQRLA